MFIIYGKSIIPNTISLENINELSIWFPSVKSDFEYIEDFEKLMNYMHKRWSGSIDFNINFLELFLGGLTNLGMHLYFSMQLAWDLSESLSECDYIGCGPMEHDFLHQYVRFLINQKLANVDYLSYLIDYKERYMQSMFLAPLTNRGRKFAKFVCDYFSANVKGDCYLIMESLLKINIDYHKYKQLKLLRKLLTK